MNDAQLLRYSRHLLLDDVGIEGQQRLLDSHAVIVGAGGLGSPAALYLAASGVGHLTLIDDDAVDLTNLQRQIAHTTERIGQPKVESAATAMLALNPDLRIDTLKLRADAAFMVVTREPVYLCPYCDSDESWPRDTLVVYMRGEPRFELGTRIRVAGKLDVGSKLDPLTGFVSMVRLVDAEIVR